MSSLGLSVPCDGVQLRFRVPQIFHLATLAINPSRRLHMAPLSRGGKVGVAVAVVVVFGVLLAIAIVYGLRAYNKAPADNRGSTSGGESGLIFFKATARKPVAPRKQGVGTIPRVSPRSPPSAAAPYGNLPADARQEYRFTEPDTPPWPAGVRVPAQDPPGAIPLDIWATGPFESLETMPPVLRRALMTWRSRGPPGVRLHFYSDAQARTFVQEYFPQHLAEYDALVPGAFKADMWRLMVVWRFGGLYVDCGAHIVADVATASRFWKLLSQADVMLVDDNNPGMPGSVFQGMVAGTPRHPLMQAALLHVVANVRRREYGHHYLDVTGPRAVGKAVMNFLGPDTVRRLQFQGRGVRPDWVPGVHPLGNGLGTAVILKYKERGVRLPDGGVLSNTKVPSYYPAVYGASGKPKPWYGDLWAQRRIYADSVH